MRTTLTLDDDVAGLVRREQARTEKPLKKLVNEALRIGLLQAAVRKRRAHYRTHAVQVGRCLIGSLDKIAKVLAVAESETFK